MNLTHELEKEKDCCAGDCCKGETQTLSPSIENTHDLVKDRYGKMAEREVSCCGTGCCGSETQNSEEVAKLLGYSAWDLSAIPEGANLGLSCGNPLQHAEVKAGETILDLGSGAGMDAFLAAKLTGETGKVIGVDMTTAMLDKARANAKTIPAKNVEFRYGYIEDLPVESNSIDLIISNCVINLSPEKEKVFAESYRVLKSGGRVIFSDLVLTKPLSAKLKNSVEAYVGCIAGAALRDEYILMMKAAGFKQIAVLDQRSYSVGFDTMGKDLADEALDAIVSVKIRGIKS